MIKKREKTPIDMVHGPLLPNIIRFAIPLMLTGVLQLLFNACDMIVVGQFAGSEPLAAAGSTTSLTNLLVNAFMGLSVGVNVLAAHSLGIGSVWVNQLRDTSDGPEVRAALHEAGVPDDHRVWVIAALGYPTAPAADKEKVAKIHFCE